MHWICHTSAEYLAQNIYINKIANHMLLIRGRHYSAFHMYTELRNKNLLIGFVWMAKIRDPECIWHQLPVVHMITHWDQSICTTTRYQLVYEYNKCTVNPRYVCIYKKSSLQSSLPDKFQAQVELCKGITLMDGDAEVSYMNLKNLSLSCCKRVLGVLLRCIHWDESRKSSISTPVQFGPDCVSIFSFVNAFFMIAGCRMRVY